MDIRKLQRAIVDGLEDVKAQAIQVFNTEHLSPLFERVIVASGTSNRQTRALASSVRETVKSRGLPVMSTEGEDNGEWIIVDCGAAVVHIMQPAIRDYYRLEELWGDKPVRMKMGGPAPAGKAAAPAAKVTPAGQPKSTVAKARIPATKAKASAAKAKASATKAKASATKAKAPAAKAKPRVDRKSPAPGPTARAAGQPSARPKRPAAR